MYILLNTNTSHQKILRSTCHFTNIRVKYIFISTWQLKINALSEVLLGAELVYLMVRYRTEWGNSSPTMNTGGSYVIWR